MWWCLSVRLIRTCANGYTFLFTNNDFYSQTQIKKLPQPYTALHIHPYTLTCCVGLNSLSDMTQLDGSTCFSSRAICSSTSQTCSTMSDCISVCLQFYTSVRYCFIHLFPTKQFTNCNNAWIIAHCIARRSSNPAFIRSVLVIYFTQLW